MVRVMLQVDPCCLFVVGETLKHGDIFIGEDVDLKMTEIN